MKYYRFYSVLASILLISASFSTKKNTYFNDEIKYIVIGKQNWMSENLSVETFRNGDPIMNAKTSDEWYKAGDSRTPAWCYYENDMKNGKIYGRLYNWFAVNDPRGLAPKGWHIPGDEEWKQLSDYLGGDTIAGQFLKSKSGWKNNGNGNNKSGFNGLPGGSRSYMLSDGVGVFWQMSEYGYWWSRTKRDNEIIALAGYVVLSSDTSGFYRNATSPEHGLYVRCIKD